MKTKSLIQTCKGVCAILVVCHQYATSIPWYTASIPWYTGRIPWYTGGILVAYHQYSTNAFTGLDQGFCFHMMVQLKFFSMSVSRLLCIALHCIASRCSIWSAFQFKADSTEIYETSMNMFLLVFNLKCIPIKTQQHWDLRELCFCFSACNAFQFVTTVCTP